MERWQSEIMPDTANCIDNKAWSRRWIWTTTRGLRGPDDWGNWWQELGVDKITEGGMEWLVENVVCYVKEQTLTYR